MKLAYPYERGQTIELYDESLKLGREDYCSTLKQSYLVSEEKTRTHSIVKKIVKKTIEDIVFKKRCIIVNR